VSQDRDIDRRPAPVAYRFLAWSVDAVCVALATAVVHVDVAQRFGGDDAANVVDAARSNGAALRLSFLVVTALYTLLPSALFGRTFGKMLLGLQVQVVETGDARVGLLRATARWAVLAGALAVPIVGVALFAIVAGWLLFDRRRQGLHDKLAGTMVVDVGIGTRTISL
jgi:uncharacterized RDD family membrane protein YckC